MVQIIGNYELVSQNNYPEYLQSMGLNEEQVKKFSQSKAPLVVSAIDSEKVTISFSNRTATFVFNQESEESIGNDIKVKTTAKLDGDTLIFNSKFSADDSVSEERVFKFTDNGAISTSVSSKGVKAVREYKRV